MDGRLRRPKGRFSRRRLLWVLGGATVFSSWLVVRLVNIQVVQAAFLSDAARQRQIKKISLPATRGEIVDRNGTVLAMDNPSYQVVAQPRLIKHPAQTAATLAHYIPFTAQQIQQAITANPQSWYALLDRSLNPTTANQLKAKNLTGITLLSSSSRVYPNGSLASQVLGFVGAKDQGLAGLELQENQVLSGKPGYEEVATDVTGAPLPQWQVASVPAVAGDNVQLSIDANIEAEAEKWLAWGVQRVNAKRGTVIIMNPKTGGILAMADYPNFNPSNYYKATSVELNNFAVQDPVPPGSIFKPITAAAALTLGVANPNTMFDTVGYKIVDGVRINDWNPAGWGWINLTKGFAESSDQVFMDLALKVGAGALYHMAQAFGLFHASNVGLPGDSAPIWLQQPQVNNVDLATIGFGQGFAVTPMAMTTAIAGLVNNGTLMQPRLVSRILSPKGQVLKSYGPQVVGHPITPAIAQEIKTMMVNEAAVGTGVPADLPGYVIGGKTGTAQKVVGGKTSNSQFVSSYIGFGPYPHPRFVMLVMIDQPVGKLFYGDQVAAPVWQKIGMFLMKYWKIKPYATAKNGTAP